MKYLNLSLILIALITLTSCSDEEMTKSIECDKLRSRAEAQNLMNQVNNEEFADSTQIIENLIGEWGLIGVVSEWFEFEAGQECIKLTIDSNMIELEDINTGSTSSTEWELKQIEANGFTIFYLETNEDMLNNRIGMETFSDNIMFGSGRWDDADIYIYEKLE